MAFVPPTLNLQAGWWFNPNWTSHWVHGTGFRPDPDDVYSCQLRAPGFRSPPGFGAPSFSVWELILPKDSDIRGPLWGDSEYWYWYDLVEVPVDSGRYYFVIQVDDVAKGFSNEYRLAFIVPTYYLEGVLWSSLANWPYAPSWPVPYP